MTTPGEKPDSAGKSIDRYTFEVVIRRAAELAMREGETEEGLSEDEVLRIGQELGLSSRHVRQALYELPELESEPTSFAKYYGPSVVSSSRVVPADAETTVGRLEEHLSTREYLQLVRRREGKLIFQPAEDTISLLARGLLRPSNRFQLARSRRVVLSARPIEEGRTHVQIATDMLDQRSSAIRTGIGAGAVGGFGLGIAGMAIVATSFEPSAVTGAMHIASLLGGTAAGIWTGITMTASGFKKRLAAARLELDGLLDRAERNERLEPPPAPWRRRIELRMLGRHGSG